MDPMGLDNQATPQKVIQILNSTPTKDGCTIAWITQEKNVSGCGLPLPWKTWHIEKFTFLWIFKGESKGRKGEEGPNSNLKKEVQYNLLDGSRVQYLASLPLKKHNTLEKSKEDTRPLN